MSLLELDRVTKLAGRRRGTGSILRDVSLRIDRGELVAVLGPRRSGRTTLLRIAAGIAHPDAGVVRFQVQDLARLGDGERRAGIAYCLTRHRTHGWQVVLDQLVTDQLMDGVGLATAEQRGCHALARVGAERCVAARFDELDQAEAVRVAVARALSLEPQLLVIDEPTLGVDILLRDEILLLLRSLADEGIAVLMVTGDAPCLSVADRRLSLDAGRLHGSTSPRLAPVLPLRRSA